ncbi:hypothetical protein VS868_03275 [Salinimicrobium sp. 3283s]|uniref:hypothetical protein n=1 Tax=Salinimicrobium sp. 3283s TaxID=3114359 RepID=UPI0031F0D095
MAKQRRRAHLQKGHNGEHQGHIEETFDDSLLPDAAEIKRLQQIDPNMITWLKERAEKEQEFRHEFTREKLGMIKSTEKGERRVNYLGLICSFLLLGGGMFISYLLITGGFEIIGSIFSGTTLVAIASIYMRKVRSSNRR